MNTINTYQNAARTLWSLLLLGALSTAAPCWGQPQDASTVPTHRPKRPGEPIRILCLDGGGTRGIIPARILQHFEKKTGKSVHELFDIIVGTSTGGIIGLALTMPNPEHPTQAMYTAKECVRFYMEQSSRIFQRSIWRTISSGFGIWGAKYDRKHLDEVLEEFFQDARLAQALCPVGVLSYSMEKHCPRLWNSYVAQREPRKNQYMHDAAAVTSAAPTYFLPKTIVSAKGEEHLTEVDGGIYANNPAIAAMIAVAQLYPDFSRKDLVLVSLGTGKRSKAQSQSFKGIRGISRLISAMMNATGEFVDEALINILPHFYDFELILPKKLMPMDKGKPEHLQQLVEHAEQLLETEQEKINELLQRLMQTRR